MEAPFLYGPGDLRLEELKLPPLSRNRVLVRIKAATLCPTDVRKYQGHVKLPTPAILGHEGAGIVEAAGDEITTIKEGDRVWVSSITGCGACEYCATGQANLCDNLLGIGFCAGSMDKCAEAQRKGMVGLFSPYTIVPENMVYKIPPTISFEEASMIEPLSIVIKTDENVGLKTAVLIGCGPMGLLHVQVMKALNASKIICIEIDEERRNLALKLGADEIIDPKKDDPISKVKELTEGKGAEFVVVATGGAAEAGCVEQAVQMAAKRGEINIFAGTYPSKDISINPNTIHYRELNLTGDYIFNNQNPYQAIRLVQRKIINVKVVRQPEFPLEDIKSAFDVYSKPGALKVGLWIQ